MKNKNINININIIIILFLIILALLIFIFLYLFKLYLSDEQDSCLDTSICKEGFEINTEYGLIKINKENCLKYNWKWDEISKRCNINN